MTLNVHADKRILPEEIQERNQLIRRSIEHLSDVNRTAIDAGSEQLKNCRSLGCRTWSANTALKIFISEGWKIAHSWQRGAAQAQTAVKPVLRTLTIASAGWSPSTNGPMRGNRSICGGHKTRRTPGL